MMMQSVTSSYAKEGQDEPVAQAAEDTSGAPQPDAGSGRQEDRSANADMECVGVWPSPTECPVGGSSTDGISGREIISSLTEHNAVHKLPKVMHGVNKPNELATTSAALAPLDEDSAPDDLRLASMYLDRLKEIVKDMDRQWKAAAQKNIEKHGPLIFGDVRWYVGEETKKKVKDRLKTIQYILEEKHGDLEAISDCLAADCFKPGETAKVLGDRFLECFEVEVKTVLKDGEPTKKQLLSVNERFLR